VREARGGLRQGHGLYDDPRCDPQLLVGRGRVRRRGKPAFDGKAEEARESLRGLRQEGGNLEGLQGEVPVAVERAEINDAGHMMKWTNPDELTRPLIGFFAG
jgi:hypothetical protein